MASSSDIKRAQPEHPILAPLVERWSPYVYEPRAVEREKLQQCLTAAAWAASSFNEQPWRFLVAERDDQAAFATMLGCLMEANQAWAQHAGVLLLTLAKKTFTYNGRPNRVAEHDIGLAAGNLSIQATALGLHVHQMAGIDPDKIRATYQVPDDFAPLTAIAIGYVGAPESQPALTERDLAPRTRKPLAEIVFAGQFGAAAGW